MPTDSSPPTHPPGVRPRRDGFTNAWVNSAGRFAGGKGSWIASARRGYLDIILNAAGADDGDNDPPDPRYWDLFGKLGFAPSPSHSLSLAFLAADDDLIFREDDEDDTDDPVFRRELRVLSLDPPFDLARHRLELGVAPK